MRSRAEPGCGHYSRHTCGQNFSFAKVLLMPDLRDLFRASGKLQRDIARAVGRSEGAISQWISGQREIPAHLVVRVEHFTGIPRAYLRPDLWETRMPDAAVTLETESSLTHLQRLEAESIHIMREVVAEADSPVMLYSIGKDSAVMVHLATKAFAPSAPPFPLLHINTTWKFRDMITFRDQRVKELGLKLIEWVNQDGVARGINPFDHGGVYTDIMKTEALKAALDHYGFDIAFGGARRDEEKSRAKERIFSFRSAGHRWDPKSQRPELWSLYNTRKNKGETIRAFPLSNWTELDIWQYIYKESIPIVPLYYAAVRPVVEYNGITVMVDDERMRIPAGLAPEMRSVRFRTLGCYPLTGAFESRADTLPDIIREMLLTTTSERQGRAIDHDSAASMERKKREGYF
jgi:sulfate adenylyltransferase subunit 2